MRDRFPLALVGALVLLAVAGSFLFQGAARGRFADVLSTWRSEPTGARALYLLAQEAGLEVDRKHDDLELLEDGTQVVLLSVFHPKTRLTRSDLFRAEAADAGVTEEELEGRERGTNTRSAPRLSKDELAKLLEHVAKGHVLVYVPVGDPDDPLLEELGASLVPVTVEGAQGVRHFVPPQPSPWTLGVQRAQAQTHTHLTLPEGAVALLQDEQLGAPVMALIPHGEGEVVVVAAPELAMNRRLGEADNAQLWLSLLAEVARSGRVSFDEFHHGFSDDRSVAQFAARYGLHFAALQLILGLCLWTLSLRRFGRPRIPPEDERVGAKDALFAASRLYREGRHHAYAAGLISRALCQDLAPLAGLPLRASAAEVARALEARQETALTALLRQVDDLAGRAHSEREVEQAATLAARARQMLHLRRRAPTNLPLSSPRKAS